MFSPRKTATPVTPLGTEPVGNVSKDVKLDEVVLKAGSKIVPTNPLLKYERTIGGTFEKSGTPPRYNGE